MLRSLQLVVRSHSGGSRDIRWLLAGMLIHFQVLVVSGAVQQEDSESLAATIIVPDHYDTTASFKLRFIVAGLLFRQAETHQVRKKAVRVFIALKLYKVDLVVAESRI